MTIITCANIEGLNVLSVHRYDVCLMNRTYSGSPKRGRYGPSKWLYLGVRSRSQGCWLTLTAGATPARGSRWRVETALALRRHSRAAGLPKEGATG